MSSASQPKIGLDARAAELKEKLLRSRGQAQSQNRANPALPSTDALVVRANPTGDAAAPVATSEPALNGHSSQRTAPSSIVIPQEVPKVTTTSASLPADANDIADLISSISSAISDAPTTVNTSTRIGLNNNIRHPDPAFGHPSPPPKTAPRISIPLKSSGTPQTKQMTQKTIPAVKNIVTTPSNAKSPASESPEEGKIINNAPQNSETLAPKATAERKSPATETKSNVFGLGSFEASDIDRRAEPARKKTEPAPAKPTPRNPPLNEAEKPRPVVPKPVASKELPKTVNGTGPGANRTAPSAKNRGHSEPLSPEDAFNRLLNQIPDLKDFLEMTDYYNVEARTRKLDRFRRAKELAAQRLRIEEEERKLREEEELEMGLHSSTVARLTSAMPSTPSGAESSLPTPTTALPSSTNTGAAKEPPIQSVNSSKRAYNDDGDENPREEKVPRLNPPPRKSIDNKTQDQQDVRPNGDRRDSQADRVGPRPRERSQDRDSARHDDRYRRSSPGRPRIRDDDGYRDRAKYDSYKGGGGGHHHDSERRGSYPVRVDLGRKGDTRFFILKSFNEENVRRCMEDGLWTTRVQNSEIFTQAFAKCKNVIFFFSINKSKAFQGYARMSTAPSPDTPRPSFVKGIHKDTSDPFRVDWLSKTAVEFYRIGHLKNAYNEHLPVLVGKDGQEIEPGCGALLLREMEQFALELGSAKGEFRKGSDGGYGGYNGYGYGGGGGYKGKKFFKRD